ncbi:MAG: ArsA family ATPase [Polyangiaceae bacterium]|nr:ArsA family ATPase [Myxococcales bacterium]MCB9588645.1 ArsA family ATPase [Polyangiaceae bacterium]MCB9605203.1 ArsA family ATPase [Polyangiaceae bacterium]
MSLPSLDALIDERRVVLCVGCGGVGKTTVAAALALAGARRGKRVLCLTIDPARRLANSLGLDRMTGEAQRVEPALFQRAGLDVQGSLTVMMLDTKRTFDELVTRHASSTAARDKILENRLYQYVSTSLAGTQEYMAMEKLLSVKQDSHYDLIVLDTPPTSNALDFLDAPERITEAIDSAAMRWFIQAFESSGKFSLNLVAKSVALVLRGIGKLTGGGFLEQMAEFITELNDLFGGFKSRAAEVAKAFRSTEFAYVLVTSPAPMAIREVLFFAERLHDQGMARDAFVVNRVHRAPRSVATEGEVEAALAQHGIRLGQDAPARLVRAVSEEQSLAELDRSHLSRLDGALANNPDGSPPTRVNIPALPSDVHDISTLAGISRLLAPGS